MDKPTILLIKKVARLGRTNLCGYCALKDTRSEKCRECLCGDSSNMVPSPTVLKILEDWKNGKG